MDVFDALGIAAIIAALALLALVGTCQPPKLTDCAETCGGPERVAHVEITANVVTCECKP